MAWAFRTGPYPLRDSQDDPAACCRVARAARDKAADEQARSRAPWYDAGGLHPQGFRGHRRIPESRQNAPPPPARVGARMAKTRKKSGTRATGTKGRPLGVSPATAPNYIAANLVA